MQRTIPSKNEYDSIRHLAGKTGRRSDGYVYQTKEMERKIVLPFNPMDDGMCRPIKRQYQQTSLANLIRGGGYAATGVIEIIRYGKDNDKHR